MPVAIFFILFFLILKKEYIKDELNIVDEISMINFFELASIFLIESKHHEDIALMIDKHTIGNIHISFLKLNFNQ